MQLLTLEDKRKAVKNYCLKHKCSDCAIAANCDGCNSKPYMFRCTSEITVLNCYDIIKNDESDDSETFANNEPLISQTQSAEPVIPETEQEDGSDIDSANTAAIEPKSTARSSIQREPALQTIPTTNNAVNHPKHYQGKHECIEIMRAMFGDEAVKSFCRCNSFKYRFRADAKNKAEDIAKAEWYEDYLIKMENEKVRNK